MTAHDPSGTPEPPADSPPGEETSYGPTAPWQTCFLPMLVFLLLALVEPSRKGGGLAGVLGIGHEFYPSVYALRVAATLLVLFAGWRSLGGWLGRPAWWTLPLGLALAMPWVGLAQLQRELGWLAGDTGRVGFDPFELYGSGTPAAWAYLALRGLGLVVLVPIVEELFLRGFLMRFVIREPFWLVPFGTLTTASLATCMLYAVGSHPAEAAAAVVWFGAVTWLAARTGRPADCILTHAATNLALGAYVIWSGAWWLL